MTIRELIDELEDLASEHGDDVEVRLAQQPRWAFEYAVGAVASVLDDTDDDHDGEPSVGERSTTSVVYIGEGQQLGYLSGAASRALGWGRDR